MDMEQLAVKPQETTNRSVRNEGRIKKLEAENEVPHQLATSAAVMAEQLKNMNESTDTLSDKVDALEAKPGKQWESIDETHTGDQYDPIPYEGNMALVSGLYYSQDGEVYLCNRDTGIAVYNALSELVGIYVEEVTI